MDLTPKYEIGSKHEGFTFTKASPIEELQLILYELEHDATGAKVMHLANDDQENLFCISFQTLPTDSTGVAHILEHLVLCGSKKYPIKDPFFSMNRRSLNTFMNAMTGPDFTCYPAASQVEKDFYNLLSVYLDAVFFPELRDLSFLQEGHRLEFQKSDDPSSPLIFKGIVFNEMKGSFSSPETRLWKALTKYLTPDLTYAHNSGGNPLDIPSLTNEALKNFHEKFYHPSRSIFFFYGNFPLENHLEFITKNVLKRKQKVPALPPIPLQKRFKHPITHEVFYPLKDKDQTKKSYFAFSWLTTTLKNKQDVLALSVIDSFLMETDASPLKLALLKSGLCTQADSYLDIDMSEIPYTITCQGADAENGEKLRELILSTLKNIASKEIDPKDVEAAIHQVEFSRLEIGGGGGPFGLTLFMRSVLPKQHGCPPENTLTIYAQFEELQKQIKDPQYLTHLIRTYLIENPHFLHLTMKPSATLEEEEEKEERKRLETIQASLSESDKEHILNQTQNLKNYQEATEGQSIECLPKIDLIDVPKDVTDFFLLHEQQGQLSIFSHECFTNHIIYADVLFDLPQISIDEIPYIQLLISILPELGVGTRDYKENLTYINTYLGDFRATLQFHPQIENPNHLKPTFGFRGKALDRHVDKLFLLFKDICRNPCFDDKERIKELILQIHTAKQNALSSNALSYAILLALGPLTLPAFISQKLNGLDYFFFIRDLVNNLDKNLPQVIEKLKNLCNRLFHFNTPHLILSCDGEQQQNLSKHNYFGLGDLPSKPFDHWKDFPITMEKKSQARIISTPVAFSAQGFKTCTIPHPHAPALSLATNLFENISLHQKIREQGGAYGAGASYTPFLGHFYFYSYRDPHIASTYQAFKESIQKIEAGEFTNQDLEEAKLGLIQALDTPVAPGRRAIIAYSQFREGRFKPIRQDFRDHLLGMNKKEVRESVQKSLGQMEDQAISVTFSNQNLIEKENQLLSSHLPIFPI